MSTKIEWTEETWNPVTGCDKISPGCKSCYAEKLAQRLQKMKQPNYANGFKLTLQPHMLEIPLKRKKPTVYFVNSMSDLFHRGVPDEYIDRVFAVMALCPQHTFQVVTKRADRMRQYLTNIGNGSYRIFDTAKQFLPKPKKTEQGFFPFPLKNVWMLVSVEDQKTADERIPSLLATPAAVRGLSCEPLLGEINIRRHLLFPPRAADCQCGHGHGFTRCPNTGGIAKECHVRGCDCRQFRTVNGIGWIIAGGESGPRARPMHPDWARSLRRQCQALNIPFFFKQWGAWFPAGEKPAEDKKWSIGAEKALTHILLWNDEEKNSSLLIGKHNAGRFLDGREWNEYPAVAAAAAAAIKREVGIHA